MTRSTRCTPLPAVASSIAVLRRVGGAGRQCLDPRHIMEEMGRVEHLIDAFEREVFM